MLIFIPPSFKLFGSTCFASMLMQENYMYTCREVCQHKEAYVRRAVLFSAACILIALHPTFIATSMLEGNADISAGLDWIRTWALEVAESDTDRECYMVRKLEALKNV